MTAENGPAAAAMTITATVPGEEHQALYLIRHGDRWDYANPEWKASAKRPGDPPLSTLGHVQARETGTFWILSLPRMVSQRPNALRGYPVHFFERCKHPTMRSMHSPW
jgi:hypothetical protein